MLKRYAILFLFLSAGVAAAGQQPENIYFGNIAKEGSANNAFYGPFNIGFTFTFFGNTYNQFYVSSNGLVTFGAGSTDGTGDPIPTAGTPNNFIAPFWDRLVVDPSGSILYTTVGAAPNQKCIIQFRNMGFNTFPVFMGTFSVILYEGSNKIQTQFRLIVDNESPRPHGSTATIGIENADGTAGKQYAFQNSTAVYTGSAISFTPETPASSTYLMETNAAYDGVYLTRNTTVPEPGITTLISPSQNSIIGAAHKFEWEESSNALSYTLYLSNYSDLTDPVVYNPGNNLFFDVTGLILDTTYYWAVFATNTTGTTWCEINKFATNSTPPLTALPRTYWVEQGAERLFELQKSGGNGSTVSATVMSLPLQGSLYQVSGGVKGLPITSVPASVSDPGLKLIYVADEGTGAGAGNFNFRVTDNTGNSPEATITINVNPPGIPNVLVASQSTSVEIQFDRPMNNPAGTEGQFSVTLDGSPITVTSAALKAGDPYSIVLTLATPLSGSGVVLVSYTKGTVSATTGGQLESFVNESVLLLSQTINFPVIPVKEYDDPDHFPGASAPGGIITYSSSNFAVATIVANRIRNIAPGTAIITAYQAGTATYAPARFERTITITKADHTIIFNPLPVVTYGDADFTIDATSTSGLSVTLTSGNPAVATVIGNLVHIVGGGNTTITATQAGNTNYLPADPVSQILNVDKIILTVTADDKTKAYLDPLPAFTFSITGLLSGETQSVINALPVAQTTATQSSDVGTYPITLTGGDDNNYDFSFVSGELTITQIEQIITFTDLPSSMVLGSQITLNASSTSGLFVLFENLSPTIATLEGSNLTGIAKGVAQIRAYNAGNINYLPAEISSTVEVTTSHRDILYLFTPNNDGFNDLWEIHGMDVLGRCDVRVFNRWGKQVYANSDYNNEWDGTSEGKPLPEGAYPFIIKTENQGTITGTVNIVR